MSLRKVSVSFYKLPKMYAAPKTTHEKPAFLTNMYCLWVHLTTRSYGIINPKKKNLSESLGDLHMISDGRWRDRNKGK